MIAVAATTRRVPDRAPATTESIVEAARIYHT